MSEHTDRPTTPPEQWGPCRLCKITWKQCIAGVKASDWIRCCPSCSHAAVIPVGLAHRTVELAELLGVPLRRKR